MRDDDVRSSLFASLDVLCARFGEELPYRGALEAGFAFGGRRLPFLSPYKGIFRAAAQTGPAALSVNAAHDLGVPLAYFVGTRPGWYKAVYPAFVDADYSSERRVLVVPGKMAGELDEPEALLPIDPAERRYAVRETRVRLHQARFRGRVIPAYHSKCAVCRLREVRLLDAAHIVGDLEQRGNAVVTNGLSLCTIHHRAFDEDLAGISPDYAVKVAPRLLDNEDGPMLQLLNAFDGKPIAVPTRLSLRPDRERLAIRFERFASAAA